MRSHRHILLSLLVLLLAAVPVVATDVIHVGGQRVILPAEKDKPAGMKAYWYVLGVGQTEEEATRDALSKARDVVFDYMKRHDESFQWQPTTTYIKKNLVKGEAKAEKDFDKPLIVREQPITRKWYSLPVGISDKDYRELQHQNTKYRQAVALRDQQLRSQGRLVLVGKIVVFALVACLLVLVYVRVDEKTKGFFSRWLGITFVGVLALVVLALYFCC